MAGPVEPPGAWWGRHIHELRWQAELARLTVDPVFQGRGVPRGDGRPVVLIPGFMAGDSSLSVMAGWLQRIGYRAHASGIVLNVDCSDRALKRLEVRVERCAERAGAKAALIGHSRGGHFAKALAHRRPDLVCSVVSMGARRANPPPPPPRVLPRPDGRRARQPLRHLAPDPRRARARARRPLAHHRPPRAP